jgi:hypothetical protein
MNDQWLATGNRFLLSSKRQRGWKTAMPEAEWLIRKQRINPRLQSLNPKWQIIAYRSALPISASV